MFSTKPIGAEIGLGLATSYQTVVEKHKGHLRCFSSPEEGTEFMIEIPISVHPNTPAQLSFHQNQGTY